MSETKKIDILSIQDPAFAKYGHIVLDCDFTGPLNWLRTYATCPTNSVHYTADEPELTTMAVIKQISQTYFGGANIQAGYCSGHTNATPALEFHPYNGYEIIAAVSNTILVVAHTDDIQNGTIHSDHCEAFLLPADTAVILRPEALHYAPNTAPGEKTFITLVVLPAGTNVGESSESFKIGTTDIPFLVTNKVLLAREGSDEANSGAYVGLIGPMIVT